MARAFVGFWLCMALAVPLASFAAEVTGKIQWARRVELTTPVSGVVAEVLVDTGDRVEQGQELLRLDPRSFRTHIKQARARVDKEEQVREEARREWERAQELYDRTVLSDHDLQLAEIAFVAADADYRAAEAELARAQLELEQSVIRAPVQGFVIRKDAEPGQTVVTRLQATPLLIVAESGRYIARVRLRRDALGELSREQEINVRVAGERYRGVVKRIGLEPVGAKGELYDLDVVFSTEPTVTLRAGQDVEVDLP